jgi:hypothetical protein
MTDTTEARALVERLRLGADYAYDTEPMHEAAAALTAALDEIDRLRRAADVSATIANGALDPTAQEACLRRDLSRVRDHLRKALKGAGQ